MAKLKSLRIKDKSFVFTSFDNDKDQAPASVVFARFPQPGELFAKINRKNIFDGVDFTALNTKDVKETITGRLVENFMQNLQAGNIDYPGFIRECVDRFENLEYEGKKIITPADFWQILPAEAADIIAAELYTYAQQRDEFTMGELSA